MIAPWTLAWLLPFAYLAQPGQGAGAESLEAMVTKYLREPDADERAKLSQRIEVEAEGDWQATMRAVQAARPWSVLRNKSAELKGTDGAEAAGIYELPLGYAPTRTYPLLVCLPEPGQNGYLAIGNAKDLLADWGDSFAKVAPFAPLPADFHRSGETTASIVEVLTLVRRQIDVDPDRTYLIAHGEAADTAWQVALARPDLLAGVVVLEGYPKLPYPEQLCRLLLPNLADTPVLSMWTAPATPEAMPEDRRHAVALHNRTLATLAEQAGLRLRAIEVPNGSSLDYGEHGDAIRAVLSSTRDYPASRVAHWFRFPEQGRAGWIQVTGMESVWTDEQISILTAPATDFEASVLETLQAKLGYVAGRIDGQTIELETRHCKGLLIRLDPSQVDLGKEVIVRCNGKVRHRGHLSPSVRTVLESARTDGDLRRPAVATLTISIETDNP